MPDPLIFEELSLTESVAANLPFLNIGNFDFLTITEFADRAGSLLVIFVQDETIAAEFVFFLDLIIELGLAFEEINISEGINLIYEWSISVSENISIIESPSVWDLVVELLAIETILSCERFTIEREENFSEFLRGYPFVEITLARIDRIEFESGVEQLVDRWGRTKKRFDITFPVSTKSEALPIRQFYERNVGKKFLFTSPIDGQTHKVTFVEDTYNLERSHFDTYFASISLIEIF